MSIDGDRARTRTMLREGHKVIDTGPYALARHPIYTAFIAGSWFYALIEAKPMPLAGAAVLTLVVTVKARDEERVLHRELGAADYDAYAARMRMLIPLPR
ncbi:methyltransferase family protein [Sphingomonas oryzagri]